MNPFEPALILLLTVSGACLALAILVLKRARVAEDALAASRERLSVLFHHSPIAVLVFDRELTVTECNERMREMLRAARDDLVGRPLASCNSGSLMRACEGALRGESARYDGPFQVGKGEEFWLQGKVSPLHSKGGIGSGILAAWDATGVKRAEALIDRLAFHDALTGLPNRTLFRDRLRQALDEAERSQTLLAVGILDLDRFATLTDAMGHSVADRLLQEVTRRMSAVMRRSDMLARVGGHELGFILTNLRGRREAMAIAEEILAAVRVPHEMDGRALPVPGSLGMALYPVDAPDAYALIDNAERALQRARELGGDQQQFFDVCMNLEAAERLLIEQGLRVALDENQFEIFFEPQVALEDGTFAGVEALVRWRHPDRGLLSPADFILVAEEAGLIGRVDLWVLRKACGLVASCNVQGANLRLAVNLSPKDLRNPDLVPAIREVLDETGLAASCLEIELTETAVITDLEMSRRTLEKVRALGVGVVLDDFGTGYASLTHLHGLPIDRVKIDRSFVMRCEADEDAATIVRALVGLAHSLGLGVVAEGVETSGQLEYLVGLGCDEAQGYFFAPAAPAPACPAMAGWSGAILTPH